MYVKIFTLATEKAAVKCCSFIKSKIKVSMLSKKNSNNRFLYFQGNF